MMASRNRAFTLLEILAAITLLVLLFSMLFQIFGSAAAVVEISRGRQEVFQYGRASLEFLERELNGAFMGADANTKTGNKGMRIYHNDSMNIKDEGKRRADTQGIFFSAAIMARDTRKERNGAPNPYYGKDVNVARVAYYLNDEKERLDESALHRSESYVLTEANPEKGTPFVRNCLYFKLDIIDQYAGSSNWAVKDWNSDDDVTVSGYTRRRGIPRAIRVKMRVTDEVRAVLYSWNEGVAFRNDAPGQPWCITVEKNPGFDYWGQRDPVVRSFSLVVYFGRR